VRAIGNCHPVVDSNVIIVGGEESTNNDANGVLCGRDPLCGVDREPRRLQPFVVTGDAVAGEHCGRV